MAAKKEFARKMPGRIAGATVDKEGRRGFVLTLQAREQHIRREKATSNICSNEALCAMRAIIYLSSIGKEGLRELAQVCADKACYLQQRLSELPGLTLRFPDRWYLNEFVVDLPLPADKVIRKLMVRDIAAGFPLVRYFPEMDHSLLLAVTEKRSKQEMDLFVHVLETIL